MPSCILNNNKYLIRKKRIKRFTSGFRDNFQTSDPRKWWGVSTRRKVNSTLKNRSPRQYLVSNTCSAQKGSALAVRGAPAFVAQYAGWSAVKWFCSFFFSIKKGPEEARCRHSWSFFGIGCDASGHLELPCFASLWRSDVECAEEYPLRFLDVTL